MSRTALIGENSVEYVNALIDIWNNSDCAVLLDWRIPFPTIIKMMKEANVNKCYIERDKYEKKTCIFPFEMEVVIYDRKLKSPQILPQYIYGKYTDNYSRNEALIIYSSGTTGTSKGIILSHYAIQTNADAIIDYIKPTKSDCFYITKTMSHSSTIIGELLVILKSKIPVLIAPVIVPPRFILNNIEKYKITILFLNPTLLSLISREFQKKEYGIASLRTIYVSGSVLDDRLYSEAHSIFYNIPIYNVYGLSEAGPRVTAQRVGCCQNNSVGRPIKNVNVMIVDESGNLVSEGNRGVIHVNSPSLFSGYVSGKLKHKPLYKNWLNTGDIGFWDKNKELHIIDRIDNLFIIDSHKIYPSEVERQILFIPGIWECAVIEIYYKDKILAACAYAGEYCSVFEFKRRLSCSLMPYEIPSIFMNLKELPKTITGKLDRENIRKIVTEYIEEAGTNG